MNDVTTRLNIIKGKTDGVKELDKLNAEIAKTNKGLSTVGKQSNSAFDGMSSGARDAKRDLDNANKSAQRLTETYRDQREAVGDVSTSLGSFAGVTSVFGAGGAGGAVTESLRFGGDIAGAIEYLPNLSDAVKVLGEDAFLSSGIVGKLSGKLFEAVPALGLAGSGFASLTLLAGGATVAIGAIVGVLALFQSNAQRAYEEAVKLAEGISTQAGAEFDAQQLLKQGRIDELKALRDSAQAEVDRVNSINQALRDTVALNENDLALIESINITKGREQAESFKEGLINLRLSQANREAIEANNEGLSETQLQLYEYNRALNTNEAQTLKSQQALKKLTDELALTDDESAKLQTTLDALTQQETELITAQETRRSQQAEDLRLKAQENALLTASQVIYEARKTALDELFASEDAKAQQDAQNAQLAQRLADIQTSALEKIGTLQADLVTRQQDASEQIADIQKKAQVDSAKRLADFERKKRDIESKFQQSRFEALLNNDVTALFQAQQERRQGNRENSEGFTQAEQEAKLANETRIAQIQSELAEFTTSQNEKIRLEREAIKTRQDAEIKAFDENEKREAKADETRRKRAEAYARLEEQFASQRESITTFYENRRLELTKQREDEALNAQLLRIDTKKQAELLALDAVKLKADELQKAILDAKSGATVANTGNIAPSTNGGLIGFANGGIVTRPTRALIGESGAEMVIPISGRRGANFGKSLTINAGGMFDGANFGAVLSPSDLEMFRAQVEGAFNQFAYEFLTQTQ